MLIQTAEKHHLSLWPLLQTLKEGCNDIVIKNGKLPLFPHNADGDILER